MDAKGPQKLPLLQNALGRDGLAIFEGLKDPKTTFDEAVLRLNEYFLGSSNILLHRREFYRAHQGPKESVEAFACRLRRLAGDCDFANVSEMLRDIFSIGVSNDRLGEKLLSEDPKQLTFEKALNLGLSMERAIANRGKVKEVETAQAISGPQRPDNHLPSSSGKFNRSSKANPHTPTPFTPKPLKTPARASVCMRCGFEKH